MKLEKIDTNKLFKCFICGTVSKFFVVEKDTFHFLCETDDESQLYKFDHHFSLYLNKDCEVIGYLINNGKYFLKWGQEIFTFYKAAYKYPGGYMYGVYNATDEECKYIQSDPIFSIFDFQDMNYFNQVVGKLLLTS